MYVHVNKDIYFVYIVFSWHSFLNKYLLDEQIANKKQIGVGSPSEILFLSILPAKQQKTRRSDYQLIKCACTCAHIPQLYRRQRVLFFEK